ncbi:MAG TPA: peptidogalycan biosysnthesis protein, partial [Myxococcaceae bacterium]|nr:peptidogalycan biosysnthesis protein [Myxococcaceae bacterium]
MTPHESFKILSSVAEVPADQWTALVGERAPPFVTWNWIHALEASGSASPETGWEPSHLTLWRDGGLVAAAPAYRKHHSMGEYVYDFSWASAARSLGIRYYPKLLVGVPLSPATAPRFLVRPGESEGVLRSSLAAHAEALARREELSSVHVIFPREAEADALEQEGWARRTGMQYHW